MLNSLARRASRFLRKRKSPGTSRPLHPLEVLEQREVPAVLIQIDYSRDSNGFFANNAEARATLERVASEIGSGLDANLAAINPSGGNTWTATVADPSTGAQLSLFNISVRSNTIIVYVGARSLSGTEAGFASTSGFSASGDRGWLDTVERRGHGGYAPWGGSIAFDSNQRWHFGESAAGLDSNELDFYSVAAHELGHILGIGTSQQWRDLVLGGSFRGTSAESVYGGPVPLGSSGTHWADGLTVNGQAVSLDPTIPYGQRVGFTSLDAAALKDLGWSDGGGRSGGGSGSAESDMILVPMAGANGVVIQYAIYNGMVFPTGQQFVPFPGYQGTFHQALGDFDADGVLDLAVATTGPGVGALAVISGRDGHHITAPRLTYGFAGMMAADVDGDGRTELITGEAMGLFVYEMVDANWFTESSYSVFGIHIQNPRPHSDGESDSIALAPVTSDVHDHGHGDDHDHESDGAPLPTESNESHTHADEDSAPIDDHVSRPAERAAIWGAADEFEEEHCGGPFIG